MLVLIERIDDQNELSWGNNRAFVASVSNDVELSFLIQDNLLLSNLGGVIKADGKLLTIADLKITVVKDSGQGIILIDNVGA